MSTQWCTTLRCHNLAPGEPARRPRLGHEVENTHVLVIFSQGGTYQVDVLNDPDWLWLRLAPNPGPLPSFEERDRQLAELEDLFTESVLLAFDGEPVAVTAEYLPLTTYDPSAPMGFGEPGTMRLTGQVPAGARTFQWAYGAVDDPYPMTIQPPVGEPVTRWLMTAKLSEVFVLAQLRPMTRAEVARQYLGLGFTHILPKGLDSELKPWRMALAFGFGLLHGMRVAGILAELGLPRSEFFTGLLTFNLGVERDSSRSSRWRFRPSRGSSTRRGTGGEPSCRLRS